MGKGNRVTFSKQCEEVHRLLSRLPMLTEPIGGLPKDGLYFFYERGEFNAHDGNPRIVRVGNHPRSQGRLVVRLTQHYGGNKNSSVFRKFLGGAILRRGDPGHPCLQPAPGRGHWEKQDAKTCERCRPVEADVSDLLRSDFAFRVVSIEDMAFRNLMERKLIGLLSACPACMPSREWLGRFAYGEKVRNSGLWNSSYVGESVSLSREGWCRFEEAVEETVALFEDEDFLAILGFLTVHGLDGWDL
ncbi:MAG: hypothetical protein ACE5IJ_07125 [Thermoplasmata archaeon]